MCSPPLDIECQIANAGLTGDWWSFTPLVEERTRYVSISPPLGSLSDILYKGYGGH